MSDELRTLIEEHGYTHASFARAVDVSPSAVRKWLDGDRPRRDTAVTIARLFPFECGAELLQQWDYADSVTALRDPRTHDPNVANGWRLDTLIAEQRQTNKILNRIEQHLAPKRPMPEESNE